MSDSNRVRLAVIRETSLGIPGAVSGDGGAAGSNLIHVRPTSEALAWNKTTRTSDEIREDRNITNLVDIGAQMGGTIGFEMHEPSIVSDGRVFMESLLCSKYGGTSAFAYTGDGQATFTVSTADNVTTGILTGGAVASIKKGWVYKIIGTVAGAGQEVPADGAWIATDIAADGSNATFTLLSLSDNGTGMETDQLPNGAYTMLLSTGIESAGVAATELNLTVNGTTATLVITAPDGITLPTFDRYQFIKLSGMATAANSGFYRISSVNADGSLVLDNLPANAVTEDHKTGGYVWFSTWMRNGTEKNSFAISTTIADIANPYSTIATGLLADQCQFSFDTTAISTGTVTIMGINQTAGAGNGLGVPAQPLTTRSMSSRANVARLMSGGTVLGGINGAKTMTLTVNNNSRAQPAIGSYGLVGIGMGYFTVTGSMSAYFQDGTSYDQFLNNAASSVSIAIGIDGAYQVVTIPRLQMSQNTHSAKGTNQDVTADINFQGLVDPISGCTMQMDYFPYCQ